MGGRRGGESVSRDRAHMAAIGRRGGQSVSRDRAHMAAIGALGGRPRKTGRLGVVECASATDAGLVRRGNEDACLVDERIGLGVVADGVGGRPDGEVASALAVASIASACGVSGSLPVAPRARLRGAIEAASLMVWERGGRKRGGMLTTAAAFLVDGEVAAAWVGDSRVYGLLSGKLCRLTTDHAVGHVLLRAVGEGPSVAVDVAVVAARPGDVLLACTDGLWGPVPENLIWEAMSLASAPGKARDAVEALVASAIERGGPDNVSVVLARLGAR